MAACIVARRRRKVRAGMLKVYRPVPFVVVEAMVTPSRLRETPSPSAGVRSGPITEPENRIIGRPLARILRVNDTLQSNEGSSGSSIAGGVGAGDASVERQRP